MSRPRGSRNSRWCPLRAGTHLRGARAGRPEHDRRLGVRRERPRRRRAGKARAARVAATSWTSSAVTSFRPMRPLMFLPFIGFALFAHAVVKKVTGGVKQGATELASTIQPGHFAAGEAYFTGKPGEEKKEAPPAEGARSPGLAELEKEIAARKGEQK